MNLLRWSSNEITLYKSVNGKVDIYIELKELEHEFITEAIFNNGVKVIDLTSGIIYEVLCSEKEEDFKEKIKKYLD